MPLDAFVRGFLAVFFTFVALRYTMNILGRTARHTIDERFIHYGAPRSRARGIRIVFNVFRATIWGLCVARVIAPEVDRLLGVIAAPAVLTGLGVALMMLSYAAIEYVHAFMDHDWRSGVSEASSAGLVTTGPFAVTRNPLFLSVILGQVGFALALPSVFTLVCLLVGASAIIAQVGVEERSLRARFGATWDSYAQRTPRWLPFGAPSRTGSLEAAGK